MKFSLTLIQKIDDTTTIERPTNNKIRICQVDAIAIKLQLHFTRMQKVVQSVKRSLKNKMNATRKKSMEKKRLRRFT